MINAQELRRGNLVSHPDKIILTVTELRQNTVYCIDLYKYMAYDLSYQDIEPIILTPEILERCGFEKGPTMERGESNDVFSIQISNTSYLEYSTEVGINTEGDPVYWGEWRIVSEFMMGRIDMWSEPEHLHQLQNLFFALTRTELNINPQGLTPSQNLK